MVVVVVVEGMGGTRPPQRFDELVRSARPHQTCTLRTPADLVIPLGTARARDGQGRPWGARHFFPFFPRVGGGIAVHRLAADG